MANEKKEIAIQDACILFDLVDLELLEYFFRLGLEVYTTAYVIKEIKTEIHIKEVNKFINNGKLKIDAEGTFDDIFEMFNNFPALSLADCSVLESANRKDAFIISSDGSLRKISNRKNVIVRGVLWIIEEMYNQQLITKDFATNKLKSYSINNERSPKKLIENLIRKLEQL